MVQFVLASQSPRRRELFRLLGYPFEVMAADVDETAVGHPDPVLYVRDVTQRKAAALLPQLLAQSWPERMILVTADTTVALDGRILGKPANATDATEMLRQLRGRRHEVHTAVSLVSVGADYIGEMGRVLDVHTAVVSMREYTDAEIAAYVATGDPLDKAGAYAVQHPIFRPVTHLEGCYMGVMGLSVCHLLQLLLHLDVPLRADLTAVADAHQRYLCPLYASLI